jgi:hypothetical protein
MPGKGEVMSQKSIHPLLWIGFIGTLTIGVSFFTSVYEAFWGETEIWWTHREMRLPLTETANRFELFIGDTPLKKRLSEGTLLAVEENGASYRIGDKDVSVRLNNWEMVKSSILTRTVLSGFFSGICVVLLIVGLVQVLAARKKSG